MLDLGEESTSCQGENNHSCCQYWLTRRGFVVLFVWSFILEMSCRMAINI